MAVKLTRRVDYPMLDNANIAYYPRIYDLAHRFFEESWEKMCGISYPEMINQKRIGFPIVHIETDFVSPIRYGDSVTATIWISKVGIKSCTWKYEFHNQNGVLLWSSEQVTVCVNMDSMKSVEIPDYLRTGLEACGNE
jgi:YbgC/YbaW family acyl-CoA thioester hydrolase